MAQLVAISDLPYSRVEKEIGLTEPPKKMRKVTLGSLLGGKIKKELEKEKKAPLDELEEYLADTNVPDTSTATS